MYDSPFVANNCSDNVTDNNCNNNRNGVFITYYSPPVDLNYPNKVRLYSILYSNNKIFPKR